MKGRPTIDDHRWLQWRHLSAPNGVRILFEPEKVDDNKRSARLVLVNLVAARCELIESLIDSKFKSMVIIRGEDEKCATKLMPPT